MGEWTVDLTVRADTRLPLWDGKAVIAGDVLTVAQERALVDVLTRVALRDRVTATPEPTAEQVADLAFVRYATVAAVLAARAALVAETGKDG